MILAIVETSMELKYVIIIFIIRFELENLNVGTNDARLFIFFFADPTRGKILFGNTINAESIRTYTDVQIIFGSAIDIRIHYLYSGDSATLEQCPSVDATC